MSGRTDERARQTDSSKTWLHRRRQVAKAEKNQRLDIPNNPGSHLVNASSKHCVCVYLSVLLNKSHVLQILAQFC